VLPLETEDGPTEIEKNRIGETFMKTEKRDNLLIGNAFLIYFTLDQTFPAATWQLT